MNEVIPRPLTSLLGVEFPDWLLVFDCRWSEDLDLPLDPSGQVLMYGSERAEYALGLRSYERQEYNSASLVSSQGLADTRQPGFGHEDARNSLLSLIEHATEERAKYLALGEDWEDRDTGLGGRAFHLPVAVALANYGASLIADRRIYRVQFFNP